MMMTIMMMTIIMTMMMMMMTTAIMMLEMMLMAMTNLRGHKNKKKDAAAIEGEDNSTRRKFPAYFELYTLGKPCQKNKNLNMFPQNGLKVEPAFSAITMYGSLHWLEIYSFVSLIFSNSCDVLKSINSNFQHSISMGINIKISISQYLKIFTISSIN